MAVGSSVISDTKRVDIISDQSTVKNRVQGSETLLLLLAEYLLDIPLYFHCSHFISYFTG